MENLVLDMVSVQKKGVEKSTTKDVRNALLGSVLGTIRHHFGAILDKKKEEESTKGTNKNRSRHFLLRGLADCPELTGGF